MTVLPLRTAAAASAAATEKTHTAAIVLFPSARTAAVPATVAELSQQRRLQKIARRSLYDVMRALAKEQRAIGIEADAIQRDALQFVKTVGALLESKRIAAAAGQIEHRLAARIGERAAAAGLLPAMPEPTPPEPHFRIRFASKIALHPHYRGDGYVARLVDNLMNRSANDAQRCIDGTLAMVRSLVADLGLDDDASANFLLDLQARIHAAYWRAVLLDPPSPGKHPHDG